MKKYMGYRGAGHPAADNQPDEKDRQLPVFKISGTDFIVDIVRHEFRQANDPYNRMSMGNVKEEMGFSHFFYNPRIKNIYTGDTSQVDKLPDYVSIILVPPLKDLDPVGLARRQGLQDDFYKKNVGSSIRLLTEFTRQNRNEKVKQTVTGKNGKRKKGKAKGARF